MKKAIKTNVLRWLGSLTVLSLLVLSAAVTAFADENEPVKYMDWDEETGTLVERTCTDYEILTWRGIYNPQSGRAELNDGKWYVVSDDVNINETYDEFNRRLVVNGSAHLILMDGKKMNAACGIRLCNEKTSDGKIINGCLTIYGQSEGTGSLTTSISPMEPFAAIGGEGGNSGDTYCDFGKLVVNGGSVSALGCAGGAAIGGAGKGSGGEVVVNHGRVHAIGAPDAHLSRNYWAFGPGLDSENAEDTRITVNQDLAVVAGDSEDELLDVTDTFSEKHDQQFVHIGPSKTVTATFRAAHGKWNDKTADDRTYTFRTCEGVGLKVPADEFPEAGNEPDTHYKPEGSWSPATGTRIAEDTTFTYSYDGYVSDMSIGTAALGTGCNTAGAATVSFGDSRLFGDNKWRVIGYAGEGIASTQLNMTLLSDRILETTLFDEPDSNNIAYCKSILRTRMDAAAGMLSEEEKSVVVPRTLISSDETAYTNTDWVTGGEVKDAIMWPLSTKEAFNTDENIRIVDPDHTGLYDDDYWWWLRSAGYDRTGITAVSASGGVGTNDNPITKGYKYGVRPAFNVKLGGVLFTSLAEGGKASGASGADALREVGTTSDTSWKLTLKDTTRGDFAAAAEAGGEGIYNISYIGARTGKNEYISAIIVDSQGYITYYGRVKNLADFGDIAGTVTVDTNGKLVEGDKLYVFNEQYNGDNMTDYAGTPVDVTHAHTIIEVPAAMPTCTENGNREYWTCTSCGRKYGEPHGIYEITDDDITIPKLISIDGAKVVLSATSYVYNGKNRQPAIKTIGGETLAEGTDYNVVWPAKGTKNVGIYTVTVEGTDKYAGTAKATYKICPKGTSLKTLKRAKKALTVSWKRQAKRMSKSRITGYQIQLATNKKFTKNKKLVTVSGYKKVSRKIGKLKRGKKYYVRIRTYKTIKGQKCCSKWSKTKTAKTR